MSDMCRDYPSDDQRVTDRQMLLLTCNQEWQYTEWTFSHIINAIVTTVTVVTIQSQRTESETYGEVSLEHLRSTVRVIATDLTSIADVEAVQFVQPVRYWLHTNTHSTQHRYTHTYIHTVHSSDIFITSNVTSRHRGPKWKLRAGYRALSLQCTYYLCVALFMLRTLYFSSSSAVFSTPFVYPNFGHRPQSLVYLCAKFCFCRGLHCWASPWRKSAYSITQSLASLFDAPGTEVSNINNMWVCKARNVIIEAESEALAVAGWVTMKKEMLLV